MLNHLSIGDVQSSFKLTIAGDELSVFFNQSSVFICELIHRFLKRLNTTLLNERVEALLPQNWCLSASRALELIFHQHLLLATFRISLSNL